VTTSVGVLRETAPGEQRVALVPAQVARLSGRFRVLVEEGAGLASGYSDDEYAEAGAVLRPRRVVMAEAAIVLVVVLPDADTTAQLRPEQALLGMLDPLSNADALAALGQAGVTAISLDRVPRTLSRGQSMDPLSSQANVAGYKAVLVAADAYPGYFPMLMTAAGTVRPAEVLVLGAGVAGLQAIATARRLGAVVRGYDVRPEARAEIESLGAKCVEMPGLSASGEGGYARELTADEAAQQQEALQAAVRQSDVVITTALVPGRRPPLLVTADAVAAMKRGSVVVDLAASALGGNVEGSAPGSRVVTDNGVVLIGATNLAAQVPRAASTAYARNVTAALELLCPDGELALDPGDELQAAILVSTAEGKS
jgi:NAD(P) transhydrogenase subunit alpha